MTCVICEYTCTIHVLYMYMWWPHALLIIDERDSDVVYTHT